MKLNFEEINETYTEAAFELVVSAYLEEKSFLPFLPHIDSMKESLYKSVHELLCKRSGIAALVGGKLVGFIAGFELTELWGHCKGIYSPLYGHATKKENRNKIDQELYKKAAEFWINKKITSHALTLFAHDQDSINTWFFMGFGNRCVDSIRLAQGLDIIKSDITVKKLDMEHLHELSRVQRELHMYFNQSPLFMPRDEEDPIEYLSNWLKQENRHLWAAYKGNTAIGFMKIEPNGETFISKHPSMMNITGAYVLESERKSDVASLLLNTVQQWLIENGYKLCGVDYECFNILGNNFWNRYFEPYTYTLTRRIDERILR